MWLWKKFNNLNTTSKVIILILVILLIIGITAIILINYKKVENIPLQNDAILSSSLNIEENINKVVNQETINNEIKEEKDIQENNSNTENKQVIQSNNTNNTLANTSKNNNNVSNQTNNKQENNKQENNKQENNKTEINKETNNQTNTPIKNEQPTGSTSLANTHFKKYNKEKTNHAVSYLNNKIKQLEDYETYGGKAVAVTEKPCKSWFSYSYDEKLNSLVVSGCTLQVYVEDEYRYDSKGINYYLYDTKAYIYTY